VGVNIVVLPFMLKKLTMIRSNTEYHAFMSYSHAADGRLAPALQRGLHSIGKPWYRRPIIKVFRDETSLSASPQLWAEIERNLARSQFFVLMASDQAAASPWVRKEVEWWLANRSADTLLIVVTQGEIAWGSAVNDFDWDKTTCLPPDLCGRYREEPLYVDLRWAKQTPGLTLRHGKFRDAVLTLAAPLYGRSKDELDSEEIRQHRRFRLAAYGSAALLNILLLVSIYAVWNAREEGARADVSWREAESRRLANSAMNTLQSENNIDDAIKLAVMAWELASTDEAEAALEKLAQGSSDMARVLGQHTGGMAAHAFSPDSSLLATIGRDGSVQLWETKGWTLVGPILAGGLLNASGLAFNDAGTHLVAWNKNGDLELWDVARLRKQAITEFKGREVTSVALSANGQLIAVSDSKGLLTVWDMASNVARSPASHQYEANSVMALHFTPDGHLLMVQYWADKLRVAAWDSSSGKLSLGPYAQFDFPQDASFSRKGTRLAVIGETSSDPLGIWEVGQGLVLHKLPPVKVKGDVGMVDFDADGKMLFTQKVNFPEGHWEKWSLDGIPALKADGRSRGRAAWSQNGRWRAELVRGGWHADDERGERVLVWDMNTAGAATPTKMISTECRFRDDESGCVRRLCDKIAPSLNDDHLKKLFGIDNYVDLYDKYRAITKASLCARH
jgi:hypothetical protein